MISWNWPLIEINWIPEILIYIDKVPYHSWNIIERDLSLLSPNKKFSKYLFIQVKSFLMDFNLICERNDEISLQVLADKNSIKSHLLNIYRNSDEQWAIFFKTLYENKISFEFRKDNAHLHMGSIFISSPAIFRQWALFFEFIDQAFLIDYKLLIPMSSITPKMVEDVIFLDRMVKRRGDPRLILPLKSKQQKADSLLFTKGETRVSITDDSNISPRIGPKVFCKINASENSELFLQMLDKSIAEYNKEIHTLYEGHITKDVETYIYSSKMLFDYFTYGKENLRCDYIEPDTIKRLKNIWEQSLKVKIPLTFWNEFPKIYTTITHLCWGIVYLCNYLNRPINLIDFDEEIISHAYVNTKLSIRCKRSRISLTKIMQTVSLIYKKTSLPETTTKVWQIKNAIIDLSALESYYLPADPIDRKIVLDQISEHVFLPDSDKTELIKGNEKTLSFSKSPILDTLASIIDFHNMKETKYFSALLRLKERVDKFEIQLNNEINRLENSFDKNIQLSFDNNSRKLMEILRGEF